MGQFRFSMQTDQLNEWALIFWSSGLRLIRPQFQWLYCNKVESRKEYSVIKCRKQECCEEELPPPCTQEKYKFMYKKPFLWQHVRFLLSFLWLIVRIMAGKFQSMLEWCLVVFLPLIKARGAYRIKLGLQKGNAAFRKWMGIINIGWFKIMLTLVCDLNSE